MLSERIPQNKFSQMKPPTSLPKHLILASYSLIVTARLHTATKLQLAWFHRQVKQHVRKVVQSIITEWTNSYKALLPNEYTYAKHYCRLKAVHLPRENVFFIINKIKLNKFINLKIKIASILIALDEK